MVGFHREERNNRDNMFPISLLFLIVFICSSLAFSVVEGGKSCSTLSRFISLSYLGHLFVTSLSSTCHLLLVQVCPHLLLLSSPQPGRPGEDGRQGGSWQASCFAVWLHQAAAHGLLPPEDQEEAQSCPSTPHTTSKTSPAYSDPPGPPAYTDLSPSKAIAFGTSRTRLLQAESSQMRD